MGLETSFDNIDDLNSAWPLGTDPKSEGDDHIAGIKKALKANVTGSAIATRLNVAGNVGALAEADSLVLVLQPLATGGQLGVVDSDEIPVFLITGDVGGPGVQIGAKVAERDIVLTTVDAGLLDQSHVVGDGATGATRVKYQSDDHMVTAAQGVEVSSQDAEPRADFLDAAGGNPVGSLGVETAYPDLTGPVVVVYTNDGAGNLQRALVASDLQTVLQANNLDRAATDADGLQVFSTLKILDALGGSVLASLTADVQGAQLRGGANLLEVLAVVNANSCATIEDGSGQQQPVGFNTQPTREVSASTTILQTDNGGSVRCITGGFNVTVNASSLPEDGVVVIKNSGSSPVTLIQSAVQFQWYTGNGLLATGNRTMAPGSVATIQRRGVTAAIELYGNGLS